MLVIKKVEYQKIAGKIAADKESRRLGRIIKVEEIREKTNQIPKPFALIQVKSFLRKNIIILIECEKILKDEVEYVWFDILKEDFDREVEETRLLMRMY